MSDKINRERLKQLLHYNPDTGVWRRLSKDGRSQRFKSVGSAKWDGYRRILVDGRRYLSSRLAFLYMEGYFPEYQVDHINGVRSDDRWCNLRHVSASCNMINKYLASNNTSGVTGVAKDRKCNSWITRITVKGIRKVVGRYPTKLEAVKARWEAEKRYGYVTCCSRSSAYRYIEKGEK